MPLSGLAGVGFLVDLHETHQPAKAANALLIYEVALTA